MSQKDTGLGGVITVKPDWVQSHCPHCEKLCNTRVDKLPQQEMCTACGTQFEVQHP